LHQATNRKPHPPGFRATHKRCVGASRVITDPQGANLRVGKASQSTPLTMRGNDQPHVRTK
jgi:hypothetical protein